MESVPPSRNLRLKLKIRGMLHLYIPLSSKLYYR